MPAFTCSTAPKLKARLFTSHSPEENCLLEKHGCHHAAHPPYIKGVVIVTDVHKKLRSFIEPEQY
jgi:hypothetical protein